MLLYNRAYTQTRTYLRKDAISLRRFSFYKIFHFEGPQSGFFLRIVKDRKFLRDRGPKRLLFSAYSEEDKFF